MLERVRDHVDVRCLVGEEQVLSDRSREERVVDSVEDVGDRIVLGEDRLVDHGPGIGGLEHRHGYTGLFGERLEDTLRTQQTSRGSSTRSRLVLTRSTHTQRRRAQQR